MTEIASFPHLFVYAVYATVSVGLTLWLARTLFKNGEVFLEDVFADQPRMAAAVNRLLVVGFYLFNLGYAFSVLAVRGPVPSPVAALEVLAQKLGTLMLVLAVMHFCNLFLFHRIRRRARIRMAPPPIEPQAFHRERATVSAGLNGR
jgi:hypothetical protein